MISKAISPQALDTYVLKSHPEANFLQSSKWGKVYELTGDKVHYLGFYVGEKLVGTCVAIVKPARRGRYLEIPGGPILDWSNQKQIAGALAAIKQLATQEDCVFVRMRPNIPDTPANRKTFKYNHFQPSPMHLHAEHTVIIDLTKPEAQLLSDMRRQTRYEVRRAAKLGIKITSSADQAAFEKFYSAQLETSKRQHFIPSARDFILAQHSAFGDEAKVYIAEYQHQPLAFGLIILRAPEAIYHEAASTAAGRSLPGAYALQWQIIKDAKNLGLKRYNLFGIAPPNTEHHRYSGVTTFKKGFGGQTVSYIPAYDLVIDPARYQITRLVEIIRKKKRKL